MSSKDTGERCREADPVGPTAAGRPPAAEARARKLALALRANLRRRKEQARARGGADPPGEPGTPGRGGADG